MIKNKFSIIITFITAMVLSFFLFALISEENGSFDEVPTIDTKSWFITLDYINATARKIWTKEIVDQGKKQGMKFGEQWQEIGVDEGPLPALFFRYTAKILAKTSSPRIGLFLSSPKPINPSNQLTEESLLLFKKIEKSRKPAFEYIKDDQNFVGMFPDLASAKQCVTCHNEHVDTPKKDWKLNDIMGASVWIIDQEKVSLSDYINGIDSLVAAITSAYQRYLEKTKTFKKPPVIGDKWPSQGYYLPKVEIFAAKVRATYSDRVLQDLMKASQTAKRELSNG